MIATLVVTYPGRLATALLIACTVAVAVRVVRRGTRFVGVALRTFVAGLLAAGGGGLLAAAGGTNGHILLIVLALAGGLWLIREVYQGLAGTVSRAGRLWLLVSRLGVWAVLLVLFARPTWNRVSATWERPILGVLLDHSQSMDIADPGGEEEVERTRAERANAVLATAESVISRLADGYDVRLRAVTSRPELTESWALVPRSGVTGLAAALRDAVAWRSPRGRPPVALLLVSDGADNVADESAVLQAAENLAGQGTALFAVGVGPEPGQTPLVELSPLAVPPRAEIRDKLHVPVSARVQGCRGHAVRVELLWNEELEEACDAQVDYDSMQLERSFDVFPPGPGAHHLTVRVELPAALGGDAFIASTVVEVSADKIYVLYLEQTPRTESAFVMRALRGDATFDVTPRFLFDDDIVADDRAASGFWTGYDVVLLGRLQATLGSPVLESLMQMVSERGVGLLVAGGGSVVGDGRYAASALADLVPVRLDRRAAHVTEPVRFTPTPAGLGHAVLRGVADGDVSGADAGDAAMLWMQLPMLSGAVPFGGTKPAAVVLGTDNAGRPMLVAHDVGRGRCIAAAWESTWPWALASDEGSALHRRFWRQMVTWLANRRPRAWVVTDQPTYAAAGLRDGNRRIRVRAGITGLPAHTPASATGSVEAQLTLESLDDQGQVSESWNVQIERYGDGWRAELPPAAGEATVAKEGSYRLTFTARPLIDGRIEALDAHTRFDVVAQNLEHRAPTANLQLIRSAAEQTSSCGGRYSDIDDLPDVLEDLAGEDRRRRVETRTQYDPLEDEPWTLLCWLVIAAGTEWVLRKRSALA